MDCRIYSLVSHGRLCAGGKPGAKRPSGAGHADPSSLGPDRWELVMSGVAVLDREMGLVWDRSPSLLANTWVGAFFSCSSKEIGSRLGWRLPTLEELSSLLDTTVGFAPNITTGHPFSNLQSEYWSSTSAPPSHPPFKGIVSIGGAGFFVDFRNISNNLFHVWCVRGGSGHDAQ